MKTDRKFPIVKESKGITATVYATPGRKGYGLFTLVHYQDRERKRETFADLRQAEDRASEVLESLSRGEIVATGIKSQDVTAFHRAQEILRPTGFSLESACKEFAEAQRLLNGVSLPA